MSMHTFNLSALRTLILGLCAGLATLLCAAPAAAQSADTVAMDLRMMEDSAPFRRAADSFVASAMATETATTTVQSMLSRALVERSGQEAVRQALDTRILPFFRQGRAVGRSVTVTRSTDANGQQGFAFYMWLQADGGGSLRPFTVYVTQEDGRATVANVVPDRLMEGRHR